MEAIDGTGIFTMTVAEVGREPVRPDEAKSPGIYISSGSGNSELGSISNLRGDAEQVFTLDLIVESTTPNADMDSLLSDVRNAVERSASNIKATVIANGSVTDVVASDWTPVLTDPGIHELVYFRQVDVVISYLYTRGSA
jgi:hypothetical protein